MLVIPKKEFLKHTKYGECVIADTVKVEWVDLGESLHGGDYDPEDPKDVSVLRFDGYYWDEDTEWTELNDSSYCTQVPVDTPKPILNEMLRHIADEYLACHESGASVKKIGERLSWIDPTNYKEKS